MKSLLYVIFTVWLVSSLQAAGEGLKKSETKAEPAAVVIPRSVFETSSVHKDPFHPRSTRRVKTEPVVKEGTTPAPEVKLTDFLVFNGRSGPANRQLAMINGRTLAVGEEGEVPTERGKVKIRCLEIRPDAVIVAVGAEGTKSELKLKH